LSRLNSTAAVGRKDTLCWDFERDGKKEESRGSIRHITKCRWWSSQGRAASSSTDLQAKMAEEQRSVSLPRQKKGEGGLRRCSSSRRKRQTPNDPRPDAPASRLSVERLATSSRREAGNCSGKQLTAFRKLCMMRLSKISPFQTAIWRSCIYSSSGCDKRLPKRTIGGLRVRRVRSTLSITRPKRPGEGSISLAPGDRGARVWKRDSSGNGEAITADRVLHAHRYRESKGSEPSSSLRNSSS